MRKIFCLFVVLLMPAIFLQAQTVTSKSFNEIKRSKQYFYYDITMESEDEAKNAANINLAKLKIDYKRKGKKYGLERRAVSENG